MGEFFYLSWQKKHDTLISATLPNAMISNSEKSNVQLSSTDQLNTIILNNSRKNTDNSFFLTDKNIPIEKLWEKLQASIDQQYIEPIHTEGSAHYIFNQMLEKEANHPLIHSARIQLASAYLNLSKKARETEDWNRAEQYSQQAILVRNPDIFFPTQKK